MFKKLINVFKKEKEPVEVIETIEADGIIVPEAPKLLIEEVAKTPVKEEDLYVSEYVEELVELESIPVIEPEGVEEIIIEEFDDSELDMDTSFRFEVYVGENEDEVFLVNKHDFPSVEEARNFAIQYAKENGKPLFFVHEEVTMENGETSFHRHY